MSDEINPEAQLKQCVAAVRGCVGGLINEGYHPGIVAAATGATAGRLVAYSTVDTQEELMGHVLAAARLGLHEGNALWEEDLNEGK